MVKITIQIHVNFLTSNSQFWDDLMSMCILLRVLGRVDVGCSVEVSETFVVHIFAKMEIVFPKRLKYNLQRSVVFNVLRT
jgi:hypothetical protein